MIAQATVDELRRHGDNGSWMRNCRRRRSSSPLGTFLAHHGFPRCGGSSMNTQEYSHLARYFLNLAREVSNRSDKAAMLGIATFWMERAEEAEERKPKQQAQAG